MAVFRNIPVIIVLAVGVVCALGWLGVQIRPKPFPPFPEEPLPLRTVPLPNGLPGPVERFYRIVYGNELPVVEAAVILGRGVLKPFMNIPIPARFVLIHDAGKDCRLYFESTIFGIPFLKENNGYVNGTAFIDRSTAGVTNKLRSKRILNFGVWAEAIWFPAIWETSPGVQWKQVDADTVLLCLPSQRPEEIYLIHFDPSSGLIDGMESLCCHDNGKEQIKVQQNTQNKIKLLSSRKSLNSVSSVLYPDQGSPWVSINAEKIIFNVDVNIYIRQSGY